MLNKIIRNYYKFFDEKLESGTLVVLVIALIIVLAGTIMENDKIITYSKSNILENPSTQSGYIIINNQSYKIQINK